MRRDDIEGFLQRAFSDAGSVGSGPAGGSAQPQHERVIANLQAKQKATARELAVRCWTT
jgi:hypothetical protein